MQALRTFLMRLAWLVAPASYETRVSATLDRIEGSAMVIQEESRRPSQVDEEAQAIVRRVERLRSVLEL